MDFLELARERYSCRKFSDRMVEEEKINKIIQAALLAPTAVNKQPVRIWVLKSKEALEKAAETTRHTFGAPMMLAVGGVPEEAWHRGFDGKCFADVDASIVASHIMLEIHQLGLGTTWVGHFDEDKLKERFPQMKDSSIVALFPLGYPADDAVPSERHYVSKAAEDIVSVL